MNLHESIQAFRGVKKLVESFDPMSDKAHFPDIAKLAGNYKKASQQSDAIRAQADESPAAQKALWGAHRDKKDAHAALIGRTVVDFPHLSVEDALHVAGKHITQGSMQPHEHIAVLSDLWGARDHNEHGVTFNTPARKTRAEGFVKCLQFHHPEIETVKKDMPTEGLTAVQFPGMEHIAPPEAPPEQPEEPQGQPQTQPQPKAASQPKPAPQPKQPRPAPQPKQPKQQPPQEQPEQEPVDTANPDEPDHFATEDQFSPEQAASVERSLFPTFRHPKDNMARNVPPPAPAVPHYKQVEHVQGPRPMVPFRQFGR